MPQIDPKNVEKPNCFKFFRCFSKNFCTISERLHQLKILKRLKMKKKDLQYAFPKITLQCSYANYVYVLISYGFKTMKRSTTKMPVM